MSRRSVPSLATPRFITDCNFIAMMGPGSATRTTTGWSPSALSTNADAVDAAHACDWTWRRSVGSSGRSSISASVTSRTSTCTSPQGVRTSAPAGPTRRRTGRHQKLKLRVLVRGPAINSVEVGRRPVRRRQSAHDREATHEDHRTPRLLGNDGYRADDLGHRPAGQRDDRRLTRHGSQLREESSRRESPGHAPGPGQDQAQQTEDSPAATPRSPRLWRRFDEHTPMAPEQPNTAGT